MPCRQQNRGGTLPNALSTRFRVARQSRSGHPWRAADGANTVDLSHGLVDASRSRPSGQPVSAQAILPISKEEIGGRMC
jgi:hypothetical protein